MLRALPREKRHNFAIQRLPPVKDAFWVLPGDFTGFGLELFNRQGQQFTGFSQRIRHKGQAGIVMWDSVGTGFHSARQVLPAIGCLELDIEFLGTGAQGIWRGGVQNDCLGMAVQAIGRAVFRLVFFQHHMEVGAAKTKGADPGPAWMFAADPGACLGVDVKRRVLNIQLRVGLLDVDGGRQNLMMQGQGDFDHAGCAGCRLSMPNLRFDTAQGNVLALGIVFAKNLVERGYFTQVACHGAGAVGFDQADG